MEGQEKQQGAAELMMVNPTPSVAYDPIAKKLVKIEEMLIEVALLEDGEVSTPEERTQGGGQDMPGDCYLVHTEG
jgi:hypothetical protein